LKITIIDSKPGKGKTSYAIQMMQENHEKKYIYITPFLDEVTRIIKNCDNRYFVEPDPKRGKGSKLNHLNNLLFEGINVASTHALFSNVNQDTIDGLKMNDYTLILDETMNVLEEIKLTKKDLQYLLKVNAIEINNDTKKIKWIDEEYDDFGKFADIKNACKFGDVFLIDDKICYWVFPIEIFEYFSEVYIMTYMHQGQIQTYYLDMYGTSYGIKSVEHKGTEGFGTCKRDIYGLIDYVKEDNSMYKDLITVYEGRLNRLENKKTDFSKTYYVNDKKNNKEKIKKLKTNLVNYFKKIVKGKSNDNMWTVYKDFKSLCQGDSYTKGFIECNIRATNKFRHKKHLAYCCNIYLNPMHKKLFQSNNVKVNEEYFALDKIVQWIFRSQLRDENPIDIYIPSSRMRNLLYAWMNNEM